MKHLHMLMAVVVIALFLYQSYLVLGANRRAPRVIKITNHIVYALLLLSGGWMLLQLLQANAPVQWVIAKMVLFVAAISASLKAFNPQATPSQSKVGILITAIAYVGIIILAYVKPDNLF
ncbi:SirB2 family protein [Psychrobacter frigidicola]|uniref:SirB2 family protein n=1 Tax=Psychrobacter frigidicola TaxID=45611 RepID=UPI00191834DF|nr:SirB2 family protein [Psychrobacter frigidicola]